METQRIAIANRITLQKAFTTMLICWGINKLCCVSTKYSSSAYMNAFINISHPCGHLKNHQKWKMWIKSLWVVRFWSNSQEWTITVIPSRWNWFEVQKYYRYINIIKKEHFTDFWAWTILCTDGEKSNNISSFFYVLSICVSLICTG